jgi:hypothetical protein
MDFDMTYKQLYPTDTCLEKPWDQFARQVPRRRKPFDFLSRPRYCAA